MRPRSKNIHETDLSIAIRELRATLGMTQEKFAAKLGTTLTTIARYETNERIPRARTLHALAKVADEAGETDLARLFRHTFAVEFRNVTRKGYESIIGAPLRRKIGLRETTTADLANVKKLLAEMWMLSGTLEQSSTNPAARNLAREVRLRIAAAAQLLFEQGTRALERE